MDILYKLDTVLKFISDTQSFKLDSSSITNSLKEKLDLTESKIIQILDKLIKDEYIEYSIIKKSLPSNYNNITVDEYKIYNITFEGEFFLINPGGYVKQEEDRLSENTQLDILTNRQIKNDEKLTSLTVWVAVGTVGACVIALTLLIWQVYSFYNPLLPVHK